jgi:hypothetical protein
LKKRLPNKQPRSIKQPIDEGEKMSTECVLLVDDGGESREARNLLKAAHIPFSEVRSQNGRQKRDHAPQLFTKNGTLTRLSAIRAWISLYQKS